MRNHPKPEPVFSVIVHRIYRSGARALEFLLRLIGFSKACAFVALSSVLLTISLEHFSEAVVEYTTTGHAVDMITWLFVVLLLVHDMTHTADDIREAFLTGSEVKWHAMLYMRRNRYAIRHMRRRWHKGYVFARYVRRRAKRFWK